MDEAEHCNSIGFLYYGNILSLDTPNNMKEKVIDGDIVEIRVDNTLKSIELLKTKDKVKDASVYGSGIHAMVEESLNLDELKFYLSDNHIKVQSIKRVKPSLEDVFVFLVENEKRLQTKNGVKK
jgi:ABC-2 type transport system ATP-binding protein